MKSHLNEHRCLAPATDLTSKQPGSFAGCNPPAMLAKEGALFIALSTSMTSAGTISFFASLPMRAVFSFDGPVISIFNGLESRSASLERRHAERKEAVVKLGRLQEICCGASGRYAQCCSSGEAPLCCSSASPATSETSSSCPPPRFPPCLGPPAHGCVSHLADWL